MAAFLMLVSRPFVFNANFSFVLVCSACLLMACQKIEISTGPNPNSSAMQIYGDNSGTELRSFSATADGGYICGGWVKNIPGLGEQGFIEKLDNKGNTVWYKTYGGADVDIFEEVRPTSDGGYIAIGATNSFGFGASRKDYQYDGYMVKTDAQGNTLWQKTFGGKYQDMFYDVQESPDRGFVAVGSYTANSNDLYTIQEYVVKTNAAGDSLWTRKLYLSSTNSQDPNIQPSVNSGGSLCILPNGSMGIAGWVEPPFSIGITSPVFTFIQSNGKVFLPYSVNSNIENVPYYSSANYADSYHPEKIISTPDGFEILLNTSSDAAFFAVDTFGFPHNTNFIYGLGAAFFGDCVKDGNNLLLSAVTTSNTTGFNYLWQCQTDVNFNIIHNSYFPINGFGSLYSGAVLNGNNYEIGAALTPTLVNHPDYFGIINTDLNGKIIEKNK